RADEAEARLLETFRERGRLGRRGEPVGLRRRDSVLGRRIGPEELVQRPLAAERDGRARVRDRRLDLAAVTDDAGVAEQPPDVPLAEAGDRVRVEPGERRAEGLPLAQDRQPGEARLEALEAEPLVQPALVAHRPPPLLVVVGVVRRVGGLPAARDGGYATSTFTTPSSTTTGYVSTGSNAGSDSGLPVARSNAEPWRGQMTRQVSCSHSPSASGPSSCEQRSSIA